jgi:hypothetical protein
VELKRLKATMDFYDLEALPIGAAQVDRRVLLLVLLGSEAGLRSGEIGALEWTSVTSVGACWRSSARSTTDT